MAGRQRVLVTVKTYPTLSRKYGETVCTAGLREDGTWVRIYPVPFRRLEDAEQYHKYDWLDCTLLKNANDPRPESFRPAQASELQSVGHLGTGDNWHARRELLLQRARVYSSLEDLIRGAKDNRLSLAVFKPSRILGFRWEAEEREWDPAKVSEMRARTNQKEIFAEDAWRETFKVIPKLPYSFSYRFEDASGTRSEMQVLDWEAGALYWNCLRATDGDEAAALQKVRQKYLTEFGERDLHFFLGTTQQFHFIAPNPWVIVGVLPIPHQRQLGLL